MSEYVSKKAVLEWFGLMHLEYSHNAAVSEFIESGIEIFESGTFDATEVDSEIQRLRAALKQLIEDYKRRIRSAITMIDDPEVRVEQKTRIHVKKATYQTFINEIEGIMNDEALSTTTEPTNKYFGAEWPKAEGDGNDV